jgi:transcriptional repressor NrdR
VNSRAQMHGYQTWRRRQCLRCGAVFTTRENLDLSQALRVKNKSGALQPFWRDKLLLSIHGSLTHRKAALNEASGLTDTITAELLTIAKNGVLEAAAIGTVARQTLKRFDTAASVYYAAHHQEVSV